MWHTHAMANRRRRNTVGADEIANAIHRMADAMQPVAHSLGRWFHQWDLWRWRTSCVISQQSFLWKPPQTSCICRQVARQFCFPF